MGAIPLPARVRRFEELYLLWTFSRGVLGYLWACEIDPMTAVSWAIDVGGPMMSRRERLRFAEQFEEALAEPEPERPETGMLAAATRWYCSLELPRDEDELWNGPPLWQRIRPEPIRVRLDYYERDAVYELALECLGAIEVPAPERDREPEDDIAASDLRQVLCDLGETGLVVEVQIERVEEARRVFGGLAAIGDRRGAAVAHRVCRRILATIESQRPGLATAQRAYA